MADLASVSGYGLVVAVTTLPVLAVIAVLLDSGRASRGWVFTAAYALGLVVVFAAASFGLSQLRLPRLQAPGVTSLAAGVVLLLVLAALWLWRRGRPIATAPVPPVPAAAHMGPRRAGLIGLQFAVHPENLALTFAAAAHVIDFSTAERLLTAVWFAIIGVSTVAIPTLAFAVSGGSTRARLTRVRDAIAAHKMLLTELLLAVAGLGLVVLGLWRVLRL